MAPIKKTQIRNKISPWVSNTTKSFMKERDKVRMTAVTSNRQEDWVKYRETRNRCSANLISDKKSYLKNQYEKHQEENNTKGLYCQLKSQMGWKKAGPPNALRLDGKIVRKPASIANILSDYYQKKINRLVRQTSNFSYRSSGHTKGSISQMGTKIKPDKSVGNPAGGNRSHSEPNK